MAPCYIYDYQLLGIGYCHNVGPSLPDQYLRLDYHQLKHLHFCNRGYSLGDESIFPHNSMKLTCKQVLRLPVDEGKDILEMTTGYLPGVHNPQNQVVPKASTSNSPPFPLYID